MLNTEELVQEGMIIFKKLGATYPPNPFCSLIPNPKVVILGQDPYPKGALNGYAFISADHSKGSMSNIVKCLQHSFKTDQKVDPNTWVEQGVMLMNTYFSVGKNRAWLPFTKKILSLLRSVVVIAWGKESLKVCQGSLHESCPILTFSHPSPIYQATVKHEFVFKNTNFLDCDELVESLRTLKSEWSNLVCEVSASIKWFGKREEWVCLYTFEEGGLRFKDDKASLIKGFVKCEDPRGELDKVKEYVSKWFWVSVEYQEVA